MGLSAVNNLVIDEVNYEIARRISYVASTRITLQKVANETNRKTLFASHLLRKDVLSSQYREKRS
jgi:hypothetical protein